MLSGLKHIDRSQQIDAIKIRSIAARHPCEMKYPVGLCLLNDLKNLPDIRQVRARVRIEAIGIGPIRQNIRAREKNISFEPKSLDQMPGRKASRPCDQNLHGESGVARAGKRNRPGSESKSALAS